MRSGNLELDIGTRPSMYYLPAAVFSVQVLLRCSQRKSADSYATIRSSTPAALPRFAHHSEFRKILVTSTTAWFGEYRHNFQDRRTYRANISDQTLLNLPDETVRSQRASSANSSCPSPIDGFVFHVPFPHSSRACALGSRDITKHHLPRSCSS